MRGKLEKMTGKYWCADRICTEWTEGLADLTARAEPAWQTRHQRCRAQNTLLQRSQKCDRGAKYSREILRLIMKATPCGQSPMGTPGAKCTTWGRLWGADVQILFERNGQSRQWRPACHAGGIDKIARTRELINTIQCNEATEMCNFAIVQLENGEWRMGKERYYKSGRMPLLLI